jgi:mono/diheme cytochrome c family protein
LTYFKATAPAWILGAMVALMPVCHSRAAADAPAPSFAGDIAPLLFQHCVRCHSAGGIAASIDLASYDAAKSWARQIMVTVQNRSMPPWSADPQHSMRFRNDARLEQRDIDAIAAWVGAGAPRGNGAALPAPPATRGWLDPDGREPDAVFTLPEVTLPANGELPYVLRRLKLPPSPDRWITALQVRPSNSAVVHHMGITEITLPEGLSAEQIEGFEKLARQMGIPGDSLMAMRPAVPDPVNADAYDMLGVYTPGTTYERYGDGTARLLKGGSNAYVNFNIHYATTGRPEHDRSQLALWFQPQPPAHQLYRAPAAVGTLIVNGRQLLTDDPGTKAEGTAFAIPPIPPYMADYEIIGLTAYAQPITIYQLQPHAHMRAKDFTYAVIYPDGREVTVLSVPKYDFHWQLAYELDKPLRLPRGSKLIVTAHYDNSAANSHLSGLGDGDLAHNCGPDKEAYFRRQNQSWHEMFSPLVQYSIDDVRPGAATSSGPQGRAAGRTAGASAPAGRPLKSFVEVVGCLQASPPGAWVLSRAGEPAWTAEPSTSSTELRATAGLPAGRRRYELIGVGAFDPNGHRNQRVAVKGVLIGPADSRVNVTSLQPAAAGTCQ